jgi:PKD repeat protein
VTDVRVAPHISVAVTVALAVTLSAAASCESGTATFDGMGFADFAAPSDLGAPFDGAGPVHGAFSMSGCAQFVDGPTGPECRGPAPLEVTFVPLLEGVTSALWTFAGGDPATSRALNPVVRFARPGTYAVTLAAGGPGGTTTASGTVVVTAGGPGAACDGDADCDGLLGLQCRCARGACPAGLGAGICTRSCVGGGCGPLAHCADLTRGAPPTAVVDGGAPMPVDGGEAPDGGVVGDAWRDALCLPGCSSDLDCRPGLRCRELPVLDTGAAAGGAFTFRRACFADVLADVGGACFDASAAPDPSRCLSGECEPLGSRGICTASCGSSAGGRACPSTAACATFNGRPSESLCLARCSATSPCTDPLFACQAAGGTGSFGFSVEAGVTGTFCAPKRCSGPSDCAPAGSCVAGFCSR